MIYFYWVGGPIVWYIIGFVGYVYVETQIEDNDLTWRNLSLGFGISFLGVIVLILVGVLIVNKFFADRKKSNKVFFKSKTHRSPEYQLKQLGE